jgi:hypothetical protein
VKKCCVVGEATDDNITRRMPFACRVTKVTNTHLEYVVLFAFPLKQWLPEHASVLNFKDEMQTALFRDPLRTAL